MVDFHMMQVREIQDAIKRESALVTWGKRPPALENFLEQNGGSQMDKITRSDYLTLLGRLGLAIQGINYYK